jgi:PPOX class probable F420-dependent enzyme
VATHRGTGPLAASERALVVAARVGHLATVRPDGAPHVVPVTFALSGSVLVTAVDAKAKQSTNLQRLRNLAANPAASLLVDHFDEDWAQLWWIRVDALAEIAEGPARSDGIDALTEKYPQYRTAPPDGPLLVLRPTQWVFWSAVE